jgi:hypothetical protein
MEEDLTMVIGKIFTVLFAVFTWIVSVTGVLPASTPALEQAALTSGQRSILHPEGSFALPEDQSGKLFQAQSAEAAKLILSITLDQFVSGSSDAEALRRILAYAPLVQREELPPPLEVEASVLLQMLLSGGIHDMYVCLRYCPEEELASLVPVRDSYPPQGLYQFVAIFRTKEDAAAYIDVGIFYDPASCDVFSGDGQGAFYTGFEYEGDQFLVKAAEHGFQTRLGFNALYDLGAPLLGINLQTVRIPFHWDGLDWQLQLWKGTYLSTANGGEVGFYNKPASRLLPHYDCAELKLEMSMQLYHGATLLFDYETAPHWWMGAFQYTNALTGVYPPRTLRQTGTILFKDEGMLAAFLESFERNRPGNLTGKTEGLLFTFDWAAA